MSSTFAGLTFQTIRDGNTLPIDSRALELGETHIPGSNTNVLDIGGARAKRITRRIKVPTSDAGSWQSAFSGYTLSDLVLIGTSYGTAMLEALEEHERDIDTGLACDYFTARWVLTG